MPAPNLEPLHTEFLLLQLPARGADLLLQPPLLLRTEDPELPAGRVRPGGAAFPPSSLPPPPGSRGLPGLPGLQAAPEVEHKSGPRAGRGLRRP